MTQPAPDINREGSSRTADNKEEEEEKERRSKD